VPAVVLLLLEDDFDELLVRDAVLELEGYDVVAKLWELDVDDPFDESVLVNVVELGRDDVVVRLFDDVEIDAMVE